MAEKAGKVETRRVGWADRVAGERLVKYWKEVAGWLEH